MHVVLSSKYLNQYSSIGRESQFTPKDRETTSSYTVEQKAHAAGFTALQVLGIFMFGSIAGLILGSTCARTETAVTLPGNTQVTFKGYGLIPVIAGIALDLLHNSARLSKELFLFRFFLLVFWHTQ